MANSQVYPGESWTFTHAGQEYRAQVEHDPDLGAPWDEHDGHCPVRRVSHDYGTKYGESKHPGEFVFLRGDRREWSYVVDLPECLALARADGWGTSEENIARFVSQHRRIPTPREFTCLAVLSDIEYLKGWCSDYWHWVYVGVTPIDADGEDVGETAYLGGIESLSGDFIRDEVCPDLASQCAMEALGTDE